MLHNERAQAGFGQIEHLPRGKGYATPRSYGVSNSAPYATAPAVGSAGDTYFNTTNKTLYISDGTAWQLQPYVPPQTPPATGNNYFTDAAGEVWVSQAGGVWKKATGSCGRSLTKGRSCMKRHTAQWVRKAGPKFGTASTNSGGSFYDLF